MPVIRIIAFRHGQTEANKKNILQGPNFDFGLNQEGITQAQSLAEQIAQTCNPDLPIKIISSQLLRAVETANIIYSSLQTSHPHITQPTIDPLLNERSFGSWQGMDKKLFHEQTTAAKLKYKELTNREHRYQFQLAPGIETDAQVVIRIHTALVQALKHLANIDCTLLVSSHGNILRTLKEYMEDSPDLAALENGSWFEIDIAKLTTMALPQINRQ